MLVLMLVLLLLLSLGETGRPDWIDRDDAEGEAFCGKGMRAGLSSCRLLSQPWLLAIGCWANMGV